MNRTRYLPPGSMRRQRRLGRLEGSVGTLVLVCAIGLGLVAATPGELYRSAPATLHPTPAGSAAPGIALQIPPCTGAGKDCTEVESDGAVTLLPRTGPQPAPLPQVQHQANHVPEPATLALIGAALGGLVWRKS
ncbi:MAG TPA: PEP-CTERM sorting domain-containing protein [Thiomonas arsenitoxydans]|uniref:PEP-CTERM sorting domain-containing protein n=1 Tax=Thiomonas arsenitoxydans (strain DSM 22701 / CIP 110005 / 3As) TaxID=426114 RepID=UPI002C3BBDA9|nr:PEP-CTERM sorting domain-containing protein [Thiomonas arsenitoxydans]HML83291.1 PEP-CTERM sorting domain-containing protein [Thiomonas arsenitoxydans]